MFFGNGNSIFTFFDSYFMVIFLYSVGKLVKFNIFNKEIN